jgi:hypothetical protein
MTWRDFNPEEVLASAAIGAATGGLLGKVGTGAQVVVGALGLGMTAASVKSDLEAGNTQTAALTVSLGIVGAVAGSFTQGGGPTVGGGSALAWAPALAISHAGALGGALAATAPAPIHGVGTMLSSGRDGGRSTPRSQAEPREPKEAPIGALEEASAAAQRAAERVSEFRVPLKHQPGAGGTWSKFASTTDPKELIAEALQSPDSLILPNNRPQSFKLLHNFHRPIGEYGETWLRVVFGVGPEHGRVWTAFPEHGP